MPSTPGSLVIALPAGLLAALKRRHWQGFLVNALAQVGMAIPVFWGGILLVLLFAVKLRWLPANGYVPLSQDLGKWASHLVLPAVTHSVVQGAVLTRYVRSAFIEVLNEDYYRTARAIGCSDCSSTDAAAASTASGSPPNASTCSTDISPVVAVVAHVVAALALGVACGSRGGYQLDGGEHCHQ